MADKIHETLVSALQLAVIRAVRLEAQRKQCARVTKQYKYLRGGSKPLISGYMVTHQADRYFGSAQHFATSLNYNEKGIVVAEQKPRLFWTFTAPSTGNTTLASVFRRRGPQSD